MRNTRREQKLEGLRSEGQVAGERARFDGPEGDTSIPATIHKHMRTRGGLKIGKMLSLAIVMLFSTDACQFDKNALHLS